LLFAVLFSSCIEPEIVKTEYFIKNESGNAIKISFTSLTNSQIGYKEEFKIIEIANNELKSIKSLDLNSNVSFKNVIRYLKLSLYDSNSHVDISNLLHWEKTLNTPVKVEYTLTLDTTINKTIENELLKNPNTKRIEFYITNQCKDSLEIKYSSLKRNNLKYEEIESSFKIKSNESKSIANVEIFDFISENDIIKKLNLAISPSLLNYDIKPSLRWSVSHIDANNVRYSFTIDTALIDSIKQIKKATFTNYIQSLTGLVAFWDFKEAAGSNRIAIGKDSFPLEEVNGLVPRINEGPLSGYSIYLNSNRYLSIPNSKTGELNIHGAKRGITVVALVKWCNDQTGFVAGMWNEYKNGGQRQYGLFVSLPFYNGRDQVCGHISYDGKNNEPFPYCMVYSASKQYITKSKWVCIGFTYDGSFIKSYYNGVFQVREPELINNTRL